MNVVANLSSKRTSEDFIAKFSSLWFYTREKQKQNLPNDDNNLFFFNVEDLFNFFRNVKNSNFSPIVQTIA